MDPAATYRIRSMESATPIGLVILLYESIGADLRKAIAAMQAGDIETRTKVLNHVLAIIAELKATLNFELGGSVARQFEQFYRLAERDIMDASFRQDAEPLRALLEPIQGILDAWREVEVRPAGRAAQAASSWMDPVPAGVRGEASSWQA